MNQTLVQQSRREPVSVGKFWNAWDDALVRYHNRTARDIAGSDSTFIDHRSLTLTRR